MTTTQITATRLEGTDYRYTNLGGAYRLYALDSDDTVRMFRTWDAMWAFARGL